MPPHRNPRREMIKGIEAIAVGGLLAFGAWLDRPASLRGGLSLPTSQEQPFRSGYVFSICAALAIGLVLLGLCRVRRAAALHRRGTSLTGTAPMR